jgi:hypothetical protein
MRFVEGLFPSLLPDRAEAALPFLQAGALLGSSRAEVRGSGVKRDESRLTGVSFLEFSGCDSEGNPPDPRQRVTQLITPSQRLREGFRHGIVGDLSIPGEREHSSPEPGTMVPIHEFKPLLGPGILHLHILHPVRLRLRAKCEDRIAHRRAVGFVARRAGSLSRPNVLT